MDGRLDRSFVCRGGSVCIFRGQEEDMTGIMIVGHGHFATGIMSAVELIAGRQAQYAAVDFPDGDTKTELVKHIREGLKSLEDCEKILVFCDLLSGSPFHTVAMEAMRDERLSVYYGVNLGMLVETFVNREIGHTWEELKERVLECGKEQLGVFVPGQTEDEEEDFWD